MKSGESRISCVAGLHAKRLENGIRDHSFPSRIIGSPDALAHRAIHYIVVLERSPESCGRRLRHHGLDNLLTTQLLLTTEYPAAAQNHFTDAEADGIKTFLRDNFHETNRQGNDTA